MEKEQGRNERMGGTEGGRREGAVIRGDICADKARGKSPRRPNNGQWRAEGRKEANGDAAILQLQLTAAGNLSGWPIARARFLPLQIGERNCN